ncbi:hypothetical protein TraAM80_03099 [Trypanosoma rangeli]|uniref:Uncharacterized protein n=1 Tax=Trypanosoma rangeli TaxID=5698 RepID=A0A422NR08_TRYRA|nr:uncharacterized protein TraAM80_03099 [Trypanosoma rangeli]RNF07819.1 hypothetical protein TraAM80_03099 [Trypanosoma rangeli]|eukprot:RNF07819.1 hypothetical protein TraAM80_03099 [Trypanosoma rangeli]
MCVNWARSYPRSPKKNWRIAHSYQLKGWVDVTYRSQLVTQMLCPILDPIPFPTHPHKTKTQAPASPSSLPWPDDERAAVERRNVKGNWWTIVTALFVLCGTLASAPSYIVLRPNPEGEGEAPFFFFCFAFGDTVLLV